MRPIRQLTRFLQAVERFHSTDVDLESQQVFYFFNGFQIFVSEYFID